MSTIAGSGHGTGDKAASLPKQKPRGGLSMFRRYVERTFGHKTQVPEPKVQEEEEEEEEDEEDSEDEASSSTQEPTGKLSRPQLEPVTSPKPARSAATAKSFDDSLEPARPTLLELESESEEYGSQDTAISSLEVHQLASQDSGAAHTDASEDAPEDIDLVEVDYAGEPGDEEPEKASELFVGEQSDDESSEDIVEVGYVPLESTHRRHWWLKRRACQTRPEAVEEPLAKRPRKARTKRVEKVEKKAEKESKKVSKEIPEKAAKKAQKEAQKVTKKAPPRRTQRKVQIVEKAPRIEVVISDSEDEPEQEEEFAPVNQLETFEVENEPEASPEPEALSPEPKASPEPVKSPEPEVSAEPEASAEPESPSLEPKVTSLESEGTSSKRPISLLDIMGSSPEDTSPEVTSPEPSPKPQPANQAHSKKVVVPNDKHHSSSEPWEETGCFSCEERFNEYLQNPTQVALRTKHDHEFTDDASPGFEGLLKALYGDDAQWRPQQLEVIESVAGGAPVTLGVFAPGAGASTCWLTPATAAKAKTTLIVVRDELAVDTVLSLEDQLPRNYLLFTKFKNSVALTKRQVVVTYPEQISTPAFKAWVARLTKKRYLNQVVAETSVDEYSWIKQFDKSSVLVLSTTLPEYQQDQLIKAVAPAKVAQFRMPTARPDVIYRCAEVATDSLSAYVKHLQTQHSIDDKVLVVVNTVSEASSVALEIGGCCYHENLSPVARRQQIRVFTNINNVMVTTREFCVTDIPNIRTVVHLTCPPTLAEYVRQANMAGCDGKGCVAVLASKPQREDTSGSEQICEFWQNNGCHRVVERYMDLDSVSPCSPMGSPVL
ncbi:hypothetical protein DICA1_F37698 [Diutina catenulata]